MKWKQTTFKQRLIRLLDSWSYCLRRYVNRNKGISSKGISPKGFTTIDNVGISLVSRCPYCGTEDWDKPKRKRDGSLCNHPTRLRVVK